MFRTVKICYRLLATFAPHVVATRKRTSDNADFFVSHENLLLAPSLTLAGESVLNIMDLLWTVQESREGSRFHLSPDSVLLIFESEVQGKGL